MGIFTAILTGLLIGTIAVSIIVIAYLTIKKLKELIRKRKEKNAQQRVAFGSTKKIVQENAKRMIDSAPSVSLSEMEQMCDENPYFVVNYDPETDEVIDFQTIKTDHYEKNVSDLIKEQGIVVFD